ncbi:MAG: hypothetical protein IH934_02815 [Nanoarchaeota archaeon]|nr:hypothetical protein [Nanoarchaeota archaeon]
MIMFSNKKSQIAARKVIFYIYVAVAVSITFLILVWIIPANFSEIAIIPTNLENYLIVQRFFTSPSCFALQDTATDRVNSWTIDLAKFKEENLNSCYDALNTDVKAYRLVLDYNGKKTPINTENWKGFLEKAETFQVFVYDSGKIQKADLLIEVQSAK